MEPGVSDGEFKQNVTIDKFCCLCSFLLDGKLTSKLLYSVLDPRSVVSEHISCQELPRKEEGRSKYVVVAELWRYRWDVEVLQNVVIALSMGQVGHRFHSVSLQHNRRKLRSWLVPDLIEYFLSLWVAFFKFVLNFSIVWPNEHRTEGMEVINKLDFVLILE